MQIELNQIQSFNLYGMPPGNWWQREICQLQDCWTFHWGVFIRPVYDWEPIVPKIVDWVTSESIDTGVDITRLAGRKALVWRVNKTQRIDSDNLIDIHSEYGGLPYGWEMNFRTAAWWIAKQYLGIILPINRKGPPNCVSWVDMVAGLLGYRLVPEDQYPMPGNLEKSPLLQYIGTVNE